MEALWNSLGLTNMQVLHMLLHTSHVGGTLVDVSWIMSVYRSAFIRKLSLSLGVAQWCNCLANAWVLLDLFPISEPL